MTRSRSPMPRDKLCVSAANVLFTTRWIFPLLLDSLVALQSPFFHGQVFSRRKENRVNPRKHHCFVSSIFSWVGAPGSLFSSTFSGGGSLAYPFPNGKASCRSSGLRCTSFKRSANCVYSRPVSMLAHLELGPGLFNFLKCASKTFTLSALALHHTAPLWPLVFRCGACLPRV